MVWPGLAPGETAAVLAGPRAFASGVVVRIGGRALLIMPVLLLDCEYMAVDEVKLEPVAAALRGDGDCKVDTELLLRKTGVCVVATKRARDVCVAKIDCEL